MKDFVQAVAGTSARFTDTISRKARGSGFAWTPCTAFKSEDAAVESILRFGHVGIDGTMRETQSMETLQAAGGASADADPALALRQRDLFVAQVLVQPFREGYPMWEVWHLQYAADPGRHEILVRLSHSIGDGITLASILLGVAKEVAAPPPKPVAGTAAPGASALGRCLSCVWSAMAGAVTAICAFFKVLLLPLRWPDSRSALRPASLNEQVGLALAAAAEAEVAPSGGGLASLRLAPDSAPPFAFAQRSFPLHLLKSACRKGEAVQRGEGRRVRYTVNDVITAASYAAMARYAAERGAAARKMTGMVVVNTRALAGLQANGFSRAARLGNDIGYVFLDFRTRPMDEQDALRGAHDDMAWLKRSPEPVIIRELNRVLRQVLPATWFIGFNRWLMAKVSFAFSNLKGPMRPLALGGLRITRVSNCFSPMLFSCQHSFISYDKEITYSIASLRSAVPEPRRILDLFAEELEKLATEY